MSATTCEHSCTSSKCWLWHAAFMRTGTFVQQQQCCQEQPRPRLPGLPVMVQQQALSADRVQIATCMPVLESLSPLTPLLAMTPLSRNTKVSTMQKAISSLAGVYHAGVGLLAEDSAASREPLAATNPLLATSLAGVPACSIWNLLVLRVDASLTVPVHRNRLLRQLSINP